MATQSYIGKGSVYIARPGKALIRIGNSSKLEFSIDEEKKEQDDYENPGGGVADSISRIKAVKIGLTVLQLSPENLAMALRGTVADLSGGAVAAEPHLDVISGGLVVFDKPQDLTKPLTVTDGADVAPVTYDEGTDYIRRRTGIEIVTGGGIANASDIEVAYTALASTSIEALTNVGEEVRLVFDGINEANGSPVFVDAFRVKPGVSKGWSLIGDDFASLEIEADVLKDDSKTGIGLSKFFTARFAAVGA